MKFNQHSELEGLHAFLGASKYHWINYDEEKLVQTCINFMAAQKGTELHEYAKMAIELKQRQPKSKKTLCAYINDAITFRMQPEQGLYYSENCFGTCDAISFDEKTKFLRIHDLKTGTTPASMNQLYIYEALFCLEYKQRPFDISSELRIYQNDEILIDVPDPNDIQEIIRKIILFDKKINKIKEG